MGVSLEDLKFHCPRCNKLVLCKVRSITVRKFMEGKIDRDTAIKRLKQNHYRHKHTEYDKSLDNYREQIDLSTKESRAYKFRDDVKARLWLFISAKEELGVCAETLKKADEKLCKLMEFKKKRADLRQIFDEEARKLILYDELATLEVFKDVVGLEEAKRQIVYSFLLPVLFPEKYGGPSPRRAQGGMLIYGPPGTGKTEFLRCLRKLCAQNLGLQCVEIHPTTVQKELIGAGERAVHEAFEEARKKPSIVIIDEADGVLSERMLWEPSYARTTLKQFLDEMDGLRTREEDKIFVVACSNEPWKIAEPAKRPGRLGIHIYAPPPNLEERERLFRLFLKEETSGEIDFKRLAELTKPTKFGYYSGADINAICDEAMKTAFQFERKAVTMVDLEEVIKKFKPSISAELVKMYEKLRGYDKDAKGKGETEPPYIT